MPKSKITKQQLIEEVRRLTDKVNEIQKARNMEVEEYKTTIRVRNESIEQLEDAVRVFRDEHVKLRNENVELEATIVKLAKLIG